VIVIRQIGTPGRLAEVDPLLIIAYGKDEPIIRRGEELIRNNLQVRITLPRRYNVAGQESLCKIDLRSYGAIEECQINALAMA